MDDALREVLDAARGEVVVGGELSPPATLIAELLVMAALSVIRARLRKADGRRLVELAPSLMRFVVEPYLARGCANADLARRHPGMRPRSQAEVVPIRPHPSVMRALRVIACTPGLSSREVEIAVSAKDKHGTDVSDVLKRLEQRGLIESARRARNRPHAWSLTPYGCRVLELNSQSCVAPLLREAQDIAGTRPSRRVESRSAASGLVLVGGRQR